MSEDKFPSRWPRDARIECANRDSKIERLRGHIKELEEVAFDAEAADVELKLQKERIEELEEAYKVATSTEHLPPGCGKHIITTDQIRAALERIDAVMNCNDWWEMHRKEEHRWGRDILEDFGIVRCEECRGTGDVGLNDCAVGCPYCKGRGWLIRADVTTLGSDRGEK